MRRFVVFGSRRIHNDDDASVREVVEGAPDVQGLESAGSCVPVDDVHAGDRRAKTLHGESVQEHRAVEFLLSCFPGPFMLL